MNWRDRIKLAREAKGWTQAQLGEAIGKSQQTVDRYEDNESDVQPRLETFQKIAEVTGHRYPWLLLGEGPARNGDGEASALDRDTIRQCIVVYSRLTRREGIEFDPEDAASAILTGYALAMKEGGITAVERVFERVLLSASK